MSNIPDIKIRCLQYFKENKLYVPHEFGIEHLPLDTKIVWENYKNCHVTGLFWINSFQSILFLTDPRLDVFTYDVAEKFLKIIYEWTEQNPLGVNTTDFSWNNHAACLRVLAFLEVYKVLPESKLYTIIVEHGKFLANENNFDGYWNHGIDQATALIEIASITRNKTWLKVGLERVEKCIKFIIDDEGVTKEQALEYQRYNYAQLISFIKKVYKKYADKLNISAENISKMPLMLCHGTQPNGEYVNLGDTSRKKAQVFSGTVAEYAATLGKSGYPPSENVKIFKSGYIFGRSGWGESRNFEDENFYSVRFGPGRIIHGHNDHMSLTFYALRKPILIDSGFNGYQKDAFRDYLRSPCAHNVVFSSSIKKFAWDAETYLTYQHIEKNEQSYVLEDTPYHGVLRKRSLFFKLDLNIIVVVDSIQSKSPQNFHQIFHFDTTTLLQEIENSCATFINGDIKIKVLQCWPYDEMNVTCGKKDPLLGWAGYSVNDTRKTNSLITTRNGKTVTFCTVFYIGNDSFDIFCTQKPIKRDGISRQLLVQFEEGEAIVLNLHDDLSLRQ